MPNTINPLLGHLSFPFKRLTSTKIIFKCGILLFTILIALISYNDIIKPHLYDPSSNTTRLSYNPNNNFLLSLLSKPVYASNETEVWQCGNITTADKTVQNLFNNTWCNGYKRWQWEAGGYNDSCDGEESSLKKDGCEGQVPNGCPQGQLPCSENYSTNCICNEGKSGTKICHKRGCSVGGVEGQTCSWSEGSYCDTCECGSTLPDPPQPSCPLSTKNCTPCRMGEQYCRGDQGDGYGFLGWACQNNNPGNIRYSQYRTNLITQMGGYEPCGEKGTFMVFSTYEQGKESFKAYIRAINAGLHKDYPECGNCTLLYFFARYADNPFYAHRIADRMGESVTIDTKLNWIVANRLEDFFAAIQYSEGFFTQEGRL